MSLQHLRSSTADKRPTPGAMSDGQLALNTNLASPGLFFKDSNGDAIKVGPVHVGTTAPNVSPAGQSGNSKGEQWLDTSSSRYVFKIWDGTAWRTEDGEFVNTSGDTMTGALVMDNQQQIRFRETTANGTNFIALQATASVASDKTLTLPDVTGTVVTTGDTGTVTSTMILDGTILNADINASAAIVDTKLATISTAGKVSGSAITSGTIGGTTAVTVSGAISTTSTVAVGQASAAANTDLDLAGTYAQTVVAVGALDINCSVGNYFTKTINGASTFTVSSVPASRSYSFTLELTHTSGAITWFSGVEWPGGTAPTLTTGKTHLFMFITDDGGTRWRASSLIDYTN